MFFKHNYFFARHVLFLNFDQNATRIPPSHTGRIRVSVLGHFCKLSVSLIVKANFVPPVASRSEEQVATESKLLGAGGNKEQLVSKHR